MLLDRADGQHELARDRAVGAALGDQAQHLALARGEAVERAVGALAREQLGDDLGVERRAAVGDAAHGVDEVVDVHDPVLEQVAQARRARRPSARPRRSARRTARRSARRSPARARAASAPRARPRRETRAAAGCRRSRCRACGRSRPARARRRPRPRRRRRSRCRAAAASARRAAARDPRRSRPAWHHRPDQGRPAGRAGHGQRAVERLDASRRDRPGRCRRRRPRRSPSSRISAISVEPTWPIAMSTIVAWACLAALASASATTK